MRSTRAWAIRMGGWTGAVEIGATSIALDPFGSAISQAVAVQDGGPATTTLSMTSAGLLVVTLSSAATLDETGNGLTRMGFSAAPYSSASTHTADALGLALSAPYDIDVIGLDEAAAVSDDRGIPLHAAHVRQSRASREWRRPVVAATLTAANWLAAIEAWNAYLTTPAEIDVLWEEDGAMGYTTLSVEAMTAAIRDPRSLVADLRIGCVS